MEGKIPFAPVLGGTDWDPVSVWRGRQALLRQRAEVLLATTNKDMRSVALAARSAGVPVVVRRAMYRPLRGNFHYRYLYGQLPAHVVMNSEATRSLTLEHSPWLPPAKTSVILNGIDVDRFAAAEAADLQLPQGAVAIGFVGRLVDWKGVLDLAAAWPVVAEAAPHAHLVVAGEGEMETQMRETIGDAPRVHWLGFRRDVPRIMAALDVLAFPSRMEGFGIAAAEAMAAGTPVVAARAGSLPELLDDGVEGRLVEPGDLGALSAALTELATDAAARQRMGTAARNRARRQFRSDRMIGEFEALLQQVVAERSTGTNGGRRE